VPSNQRGTSRNRYPFDVNVWPEWRYQLIIPPGHLGGVPFEVRDISFMPRGSGTFAASRFEVQMSHTTTPVSTTFAQNLPNPVTVLLAQNYRWFTTDQQWSPLGLPGTFTYDGTSGLCIDIRYLGGSITRFSGTCFFSWPCHDRMWTFGPGAYTATAATINNNTGLHVRITEVKARIELSGVPARGATVTFYLAAPGGGGHWYQVGSSFGQGPIPLGPHRLLPLSPDPLLVISTSGAFPMFFQNYLGTLDSNGAATARMTIPNLVALKGVRFYTAFATLDPRSPLAVSQVSSNIPVVIQ
jgi:hypothetical protein